VQRGERVGNLVLHEVVTGAHLAAEAVAADGDGHGVRAIGRGLDKTGTRRPLKRMASTMPRSSPKLGRVMMMPSISSACFLKSAAHFCDSA